jgi:hypothetical protein
MARPIPRRGLAAAAVLLVLGCLSSSARADEPTQGLELFEKKIRPVLVTNCYRCHSAQAKTPRGGLRLDSRDALLKGGDSGPAIVPGAPARSKLIEALDYRNPDLQMPPKGRLPDAVLADLAAWVKMGAPWPKDVVSKSAGGKYNFDLEDRKQKHWAWQPIRPQLPPLVKDAVWPLGPVDRFILSRLEDKNLTPAPPADRRTLIRRVTFDLIGLPPTPAEVEAFVNDPSPEAFAKVVDRLLASPHFGERWGRHWLDLVRYAESRGHEFDYNVPNAYQYRDYVIRALNADVPYDQFVTEHIAGDLLPRPRRNPTEGFNESILGTGFWFLGEQVHSPVDLCQDKADRHDNMLDVMTKTFLGLTVACARCHDHKFDAISTQDYYSLFSFLESSHYRLVRFDALDRNRAVVEELRRVRSQGSHAMRKALAEMLRPEVRRTADYLLAAREAGRGGVEAAARKHKLDPVLLSRWLAHLRGAMKEDDPLHAWALLARSEGEVGLRQAGPVRLLVEQWQKRDREAEASRNRAEVIVDYAKPGPEGWCADGFAFGLGPVRPGDVSVGGTPERPALALCERAAAEKDPAWDRLRPAAGAENEPGALAGVLRSGRTLLTPSFRIKGGKVYCRVRGQGQVYAAVDDHVMIAGPLHGKLVQPFNAGAGWQWLALDLSRYPGSRAHLEFTPTGNTPFAVAEVLQAEVPPGPVERPNRLLQNLLGDEATPETLAARYQRLLTAVVERLAADRPLTADEARLAAWLLGHLELFAADADAARRRLAETARPFVAEQAKVAAGIQVESRLAPAMLDGNGVDGHVFLRGSYKTPGEPAPRRFLEALAGPKPLAVARGSGRLELARQMTESARDPFLPRVMVNRVWHHLFGRGIVVSVDNFGVLGEPPTHPELLDYLADRFVKDGWSLKRLIRKLVLTRTYQMSSRPDERARQGDPQDLLLHRARIRRLDGEAIRDALLAVSGRLARRGYGPPVPVYLTPFQEGRGRPASGPLDGAGRRSVYLSVRRNFLPAFLLAFDTPTPFSTVGRRTVSNVPAQALILMNDPFVHGQADVWARRILARKGAAPERVRAMYLRAFARPPSAEELAACLDFLQEQARLSGGRTDDVAAWASLAHVLFNAKEFIFLN